LFPTGGKNLEYDPHIQIVCQDESSAEKVFCNYLKKDQSKGYSFFEANCINWFNPFKIGRETIRRQLGELSDLVTEIKFINLSKRGKSEK
jgi:hypothetical protein